MVLVELIDQNTHPETRPHVNYRNQRQTFQERKPWHGAFCDFFLCFPFLVLLSLSFLRNTLLKEKKEKNRC